MNSIIITGGKYRGLSIMTPGGATHPMGIRERLALFNMLMPRLQGATVLDVYAGSGALGLEALSRGAASVIFVDNDKKATEVIKKNLHTLLTQASVAKVIKANASDPEAIRKALNDAASEAAPMNAHGSIPSQAPRSPQPPEPSRAPKPSTPEYSIVIADPPYDKYTPEMIASLAPLVVPGGLLVASTPIAGPDLTGFTIVKSRKYARCHLTIYEKNR
ncbi:RsmD family RNA methyltransferase [Candidatus Saccharibacteria bacterium]|nr:RsmD family RNA methyltransferase [Candidatus Saccharibacteria bacterium]